MGTERELTMDNGQVTTAEQVCVDCGCTEHRACWDTAREEHCHWVKSDLCSVCHHRRAVMDALDGE